MEKSLVPRCYTSKLLGRQVGADGVTFVTVPDIHEVSAGLGRDTLHAV